MPEHLELSPLPESVAEARRWSADVVGRSPDHELADTVSLLVSELVSNVVLHAHTACDLTIDLTGERVRVEVRDGSGLLPARAQYTEPFALSGRGMVLIEGLTAAHGAAPLDDGGKLVWFELEHAPDGSP